MAARVALLDRMLDRRWQRSARPEQLAPAGEWATWVFLGGRGSGKTRAHAEWVKEQIKKVPACRGGLIARTKDDVRDTQVEGESGLLAVMPPSMLRGGAVSTSWNRSHTELNLADGGRLKGFSSQEPDQLRGPQHHFIWCDELAAWEDALELPDSENSTWSNAMFGLRLGLDPRCVVSTTPRPVPLLIGFRVDEETKKAGILDDVGTVITRASTYANLDNLAPDFRRRILTRYEGTRMGRQELLAELLEDVEGALWTAQLIETHRVHKAPELVRIVVSVDPAVTSTDESDLTGIVVQGKAASGQGYVLADHSGRYTPAEWAKKVVWAFDHYEADAVVGEVNNGGDLVEANVKSQARHLPFKQVRASRGKAVRAEPVATLYEKGMMHHAGSLAALEAQMTTWVPDVTPQSPDRVDALVWGAWYLHLADETRRLRYRSSGRRAA